MTEEIRRAVIQALAKRFSLPVYGQRVPQGARKPCFTVELKQGEQRRLLGRRAARKATAEVIYYCGETKTAAAEAQTVLEELYEVLCLIGTKERFAASNMQEEGTAEGLRFTAEYEYQVVLAEEAAEKMERLKYNGREAVGYEEEWSLQQRTAQ